jgi:hypothetical protein
MTTFPLLPYFLNIEARRKAAEAAAHSARERATRENGVQADLGRGQAIVSAQIARREELIRVQDAVTELGDTIQLYDDPDSVLRASVAEARRLRTRQIWQGIAVGLLLPLEMCFVTPHLVDLFMGKVNTLSGTADSVTWLRLFLCFFVSSIVLLLTFGAKESGSSSTRLGYMAILALAFSAAFYTDVRFEAANIVPSDAESSISIEDDKLEAGNSSGAGDAMKAAALTALPNAIFYLFALAIHGSLVFGAARALSPEEKVLLSFDRPAIGEQHRENRFRRDELGRQMRSEIHNAPIELRDRMLLESMRVAEIINEACGEEAIQIPEHNRDARAATVGAEQPGPVDMSNPVVNNEENPPMNYDTMENVEAIIFS